MSSFSRKKYSNIIGKNDDSVCSVAFSPDGKKIASGGWDKTVLLWDLLSKASHTSSKASIATNITSQCQVNTNSKASQIIGRHTNIICAVAFSPYGHKIISGGNDNTVRLWDLATGTGKIIGRHDDWVYSVAFSPDGKKIVSGGDDRTVLLWDLANGTSQIIGRHDDTVYSVAFSPDGKKIVSGGWDDTVRLWDLLGGTGKIIGRHDGYVNSVAFSPDGKKIASGGWDKTIRLWDLLDGTGKIIGRHENCVWSVAFSLDGKKIASGGFDNTVRLWNLSHSARADRDRGNELVDGAGKIIGRHDGSVWSVAFSPDGKKIASGGWNGMRIWINPCWLRNMKKKLLR